MVELTEGDGVDTGGRSRADAARRLLNRGVRLGPLLSAIARHRAAVALGLGVLFRMVQYLADRPLWLDEGSLAANFRHGSVIGLFGPLANSQLAPPGFLVVEWVMVRVFGASGFALRFFPLLCGIASLFLFHGVARRCLRPRDVWIALGLFAVSADLIYFASEVKQYSTDVAVGLACYLMGMKVASRPATIRRYCALAAGGAAAVWFSYPSVFILAGMGVVLMATSLAARAWRTALLTSLACLTWAASFAAIYAVALGQLGHSRGMWVFWGFAFPPMPPSSPWEATWLIRRFLYLFVNPLNFDTPLGPSLSILPAVGLFFAGCLSLWRRARDIYWMLALPVAFAILASCLRKYPFHGRLVLFLAPSLLLVIAEGAGWLRARIGPAMPWSAVLATVLLFPGLGAVYHLFVPHGRDGFSPYGDRRPAGLDPDWFPFRGLLRHSRPGVTGTWGSRRPTERSSNRSTPATTPGMDGAGGDRRWRPPDRPSPGVAVALQRVTTDWGFPISRRTASRRRLLKAIAWSGQ
jgi:hypothetical protein